MSSTLSIALFIYATLFSVIAKADQVPPELVSDARIYSACQNCTNPNYNGDFQTTNHSALLSYAESIMNPSLSKKPCRVTGDTGGYLQCTNISTGGFTDVGKYSSKIGSAYQCPSSHPIHIDNNSNGAVDSGDMCETPCQEGWNQTQVWQTLGEGGLGDDAPQGFCKAVKLQTGEIAACKYEVQQQQSYLPPFVNGGRTWMFPIVSTGEGCPIDEDGHAYTEGGEPQPQDPESEYEEPQNGDGDNNPDTDPSTVDEDGDGNTLNEDTEKIKFILTEIEDNTDDLELLGKDANKMKKKSLNGQDKTNALLKGIHDKISGVGGGAVGGGNQDIIGSSEDYSSGDNPDGLGGVNSAMDGKIQEAKDFINNKHQAETDIQNDIEGGADSIKTKASNIFTKGSCGSFTFNVAGHNVTSSTHCQASSGVVQVFEWLLWLIVLADAWYVFRHYFRPRND